MSSDRARTIGGPETRASPFQPSAMWIVIDRVIQALSFVGAVAASTGLAIIAVSVVWEVIARNVFHAPTIWSLEISTYGIATISFLGLGWVLRKGGHLEVDLVTMRLSSETRRVLGIVTDLFAAAFCALIVWYAIDFVQVSWIIGSVSVSELRVPQWIPQLTLPIGFALLCLEFLARAFVRVGLIPRKLHTADLAASA